MANPQQEKLLRGSNAYSADTQPKSLPPKRTLYAKLVTDWWLVELLAVAVGIACIVALCAVLKKYDNQPANRFNSLFGVNITLNTLISILSTLGRAALLLAVAECISQLKWKWYRSNDRPLADLDVFDQASRGAWGGFLLLWKINVRQTASIGALLIIAGLAVDPLSQQLVHFRQQSVPGPNGSASLPTAVEWNDGASDSTNNAYVGPSTSGDAVAQPPLAMKAAIQSGLYSAFSDVLDLPAVCSSGNCTWPSYRSLAICARSANVTTQLKNREVPVGGGTATRWYTSDHNYIMDRGEQLFNVSSVGKIVSVPLGQGDPFSTGNEGNEDALDFGASVAFSNVSSPLANGILIYTISRETPSIFVATEFVLQWCIQNYTTSVTNGTSSTERHGSFLDLPKPATRNTYLQVKPNDGDNREYSIDPGTHWTLQNYFRGLLSGTANLTVGNVGGTPSISNDATQALFQPFNIFGERVNGSDASPGRGEGQVGVDKILNNVATGMTNIIRNKYNTTSASAASTTSNPLIKGTADQMETFVQVQWGWIAAPIVLLVGSTLFVLATIAQSPGLGSRQRFGIWRSSNLPLLRALELHMGDASGMRNVSMMSKWAEDVPVRLSKEVDGDGWKLKQSLSKDDDAFEDKESTARAANADQRSI